MNEQIDWKELLDTAAVTGQNLVRYGQLASRNDYGLSPEQYHAGLDRLWKALGITTVQDTDVFTLAAERIVHLTEVLEDIAHHGTDQPALSDNTEWYRSVAYNCIHIAQRGLDA